MNEYENTSFPVLSPYKWFYIASLLYLVCILLSTWSITHQYNLGIKFIHNKHNKGLTIAGIYRPTTATKLNVSEQLTAISAKGFEAVPLSSLSIMEEPDNFKTFSQYNQFI